MASKGSYNSKVCVIGLGRVGYSAAKYIHLHKFEVYGYDVRPKMSADFYTTTEWDQIPIDIETFVIAVSTGLKKGQPDVTNVYDACSKISKKNTGALVCVESTVPVGTCRKLANRFHLPYLVHFPHRYWIMNPQEHGVNQLRVLGALNNESLEKGVKFCKQLEIPYHIVSRIEIAEMCKIVENAYRFVQIAFVEEIKRISDMMDLDFGEIREACNTKWNIELLEARKGIGGCPLKDTCYLLSQTNFASLLNGAVLADKSYKKGLERAKR